MKMHCYTLKNKDDAIFNNRFKNPAFVIGTLKTMLNDEVYILSLQQLEYEMDHADITNDYNVLK